MRITVERYGGFAGLNMSGSVDTDEMGSDDALDMYRMVDECAFFRLPEAMDEEEGADRFQYMVTVELGGKEHQVKMSEQAAPEQIRPLLRQVFVMARQKGR